MKFSRHFNFMNFATLFKIEKLKCRKKIAIIQFAGAKIKFHNKKLSNSQLHYHISVATFVKLYLVFFTCCCCTPDNGVVYHKNTILKLN